MPFMWLSSSLVIGLLLGFSLWPALLIGAIITPTDPVVASSIVTGPVAEENLPWPLRRLISSESGLNDGLGYAFVLLPILAIDLPPAEAARVWFLRVLLWEIAGAVVLGILFGYAAGHMLKFVERRKMIEEPSLVAYTTALALTTLSAVNLMGSDGILAVFVCGIAFDQTVAASDRESESRVVEGVDRFFTLPIFGLLGLLAPWQQWLELGWTCVALALVILGVRRLPLFLVLGLRIQDMQKTPDYIFAGWFGPIGVAALYYVALAAKQSTVPQAWPTVSLIVSFSIFVHGLTATPFTRLYSRFAHP